jgi:release factor glutamine methyltransferase
MTSTAAGPTVGALLAATTERLRLSGSDTPRLDAELLLGYVLGIDRTGVVAHPEARIGDGQIPQVETAVRRREGGEPVAYIRGVKEFHGLAISVDSRVLIPRPDTELLVDTAADRVREVLTRGTWDGRRPFRIWDVGTGSGAIALAIGAELRRRRYGGSFRVLATDVSADALAVAVENAVGHGLADAIDFARGDLFAVEPEAELPFDLVVANLPYIATDELPRLAVAASFEPASALDGGPDGLGVVRRLLGGLEDVLAPGGQALLEIGADQGAAAVDAANAALPAWRSWIAHDLAGRPRILGVERPMDERPA